MLMDYFNNDNSDKEEVLLDLKMVKWSELKLSPRPLDLVTTVVEDDEGKVWLCASNLRLVESFTGNAEVKITFHFC